MSAARRLRRLLARLGSHSGGASATELALVLPVLLMLITGAVDVARAFSVKLDLEQAAHRTADLGLARKPKNSDAFYLKQEAAAIAGTGAVIDIAITLECDGIEQTSLSGSCDTGQSAARLIRVSIVRDHGFFFDYGALTALFGFRLLPPSVALRGDSVVRFQ